MRGLVDKGVLGHRMKGELIWLNGCVQVGLHVMLVKTDWLVTGMSQGCHRHATGMSQV